MEPKQIDAAVRDRLFIRLRSLVPEYSRLSRQYDAVYSGTSAAESEPVLRHPTETSMSFVVQEEGIDDEKFRRAMLGLMEAFNQTNEMAAVTLLIQKALFSAERGNVASTPFSADGLKYAERQIDREMETKPSLVLIPPELEPIAIRLERDGVRCNYRVMDYLGSPSAWFVLTAVPGFVRKTLVPFDLLIDNNIVKGYEHVSWECHDFRAIWGSFPDGDGRPVTLDAPDAGDRRAALLRCLIEEEALDAPEPPPQ